MGKVVARPKGKSRVSSSHSYLVLQSVLFCGQMSLPVSVLGTGQNGLSIVLYPKFVLYVIFFPDNYPKMLVQLFLRLHLR